MVNLILFLFVLIYCFSDARSMYGLFFAATGKAHVFAVDRVRTNQMPNLGNLYQTERTYR